jgi:hypothetical protein
VSVEAELLLSVAVAASLAVELADVPLHVAESVVELVAEVSADPAASVVVLAEPAAEPVSAAASVAESAAPSRLCADARTFAPLIHSAATSAGAVHRKFRFIAFSPSKEWCPVKCCPRFRLVNSLRGSTSRATTNCPKAQ